MDESKTTTTEQYIAGYKDGSIATRKKDNQIVREFYITFFHSGWTIEQVEDLMKKCNAGEEK